MDMEGVLAITFIFGGGTLFLLSLSPVGRALAERIRPRAAAGAGSGVAGRGGRAAGRSVGVARAGGFRGAAARPATGTGKDRGQRVSPDQV